MEPSAWIAFAALMLTILTVSGGGLWALFSKIETNRASHAKLVADTQKLQDSKLSELAKHHERDMEGVRRDLESVERRAAEPLFAIREKVAGVELYIRDYFVSKREYEKDYAQLLLAIRQMQEAIEKRLDSYEDRVEKALQGQGRSTVG